MEDIAHEPAARYPRRQYFVFSDAGKPVFVSADGPDTERFTTTFGIMQALISVFIDDGDKLRCINAGRTRITFLQRAPLYYACVSAWGEPESVTRTHLDYLHLQILSIVTAAQLRRIFERRTNFDLRRLLNGAEGFLSSLLERMELDLALSTSSLWCLRLDLGLRKRIAEALIPPPKKEILYVVLMARGRVVTLIRPRKHSVHPADIHILLNTVYAPSILNAPAATSWIPMCLPKFNPSGFVNAYISFLSRPESPPATILVQPSGNLPSEASRESLQPESTSEVTRAPSPSGLSVDDPLPPQEAPYDDPNVVLVCISGGAEFDIVRGWCDSACERLVSEGSLSSLVSACTTEQGTEYSVGELGIPGLRHFIYKARAQVQVTMPVFEDPYEGVNESRRLVTLYQTLHDAIHARSGQGGTLKLQYIKTEKESVMGWITQPFELYIALSPLLPKTAVINAANAVVRWIRKEDAKLFLRDAPVF
ncbi:vacuolar fusion protein MON1 [Schizophyllum fasciatum]